MTQAPLSLVIFDVDGTLIDSQHVIVETMNDAFIDCAMPAPTPDAVRSIIGLSLPQSMAALAPSATAAEVDGLVYAYRTGFVRRREAGGAEPPLFPGARDALATLTAGERLISIATGKSRRGLDHVIAAHGLDGVFSFPQTADDAPSKPHPQMVETSIVLHGALAERTVVVGDTTFDIQMARAAGARAIGVGWGYHPVERLAAAGADIIVGRFDQLDGAVAELMGEA